MNATENATANEVIVETCAYCGAIVREDGEWVGNCDVYAVEVDGHLYCDTTCAHNDGYESCERCGEWFNRNDDGFEVDGDYYCSEECAINDGYERCTYCGEWARDYDAIFIEGGGIYCSEECAEQDGNTRCERCGEWARDSDTYTVISDGFEEAWCEGCHDSHSSSCEGCGDCFDDSDMRYSENGCWYCPSCYEQNEDSESLHHYGYTPEIRFFGEGKLFFGVELETDGGDCRRDYVEELASIDGFPDRFWMTEDGSLENGVEITSQPMTLRTHLELVELYDEIAATARRYGYGSHDGGRCGLHVHVNRDFFGKTRQAKDVGGYKLMRLLQRFEHQFTVFSRRNSNRWCSYRTGNDFAPKKETAVSVATTYGNGMSDAGIFVKAREMSYETTHAQALNFQHHQTFEFRIFRGTLRWETYYACLALVEGMCRLVKEHGSEYVENVDWYTLMRDVLDMVSEPKAAMYLGNYLESKCLL